MADIEQVQDKLACCYFQIQQVRDVVSGAQTVKRKGEFYLPRSRTNQPDEEYRRLLHYTSFFPATNRTAQGKRGLMMARNVVLNAPVLEPIKDVITPQGASIRDMAEDVIWETLQTNFTGLLADHPDAPAGADLNAQNALELNFRPFLHVYPMESILWIDYAVNGARRTYDRVVLRESCDRILELLMVGGAYVQRVWTRQQGQPFEVLESRVPSKDGQPLREIPFVVVSDNTKPYPLPSVLQDVAQLNLDHYLIASRIANIEMFGSGVVPVFSGIKLERDDQGNAKDPGIYTGPGGTIVLEDPMAKAYFLEPEGKTLSGLYTSLENKTEDLSKVGARLIASERNKAPESDSQSSRRAAAEDSATASLAITYARRISDALSWCSWWMDGSKAQFTLNTDYLNNTMTAQDRTIALAELQAGVRSYDDWFYERRDRGVVNSSLTPEEERARIEQDAVDRPPTNAL